MNAVIEAIKKRRSVRSYKSNAVPRDLIKAIIGRGMKPRRNEQPALEICGRRGHGSEKRTSSGFPAECQKDPGYLKRIRSVRYEAITKRLSELPDPVSTLRR